MTNKLDALRQTALDLDEAKTEVLRLERRLEAAKRTVIAAEAKYAQALDALHSSVRV